MLLTLIKTHRTRYGWCADLIEVNHLTGNRFLAKVHVADDEFPLELIYPLHITKSGIYIRRQRIEWYWRNKDDYHKVEAYLLEVQKIREEIYLDVAEKAHPFLEENFFYR